MGLDVYMYKYNQDRATLRKLSEEFKLRSEPLWEDGVAEKERERKLEALRFEFGLADNWGGFTPEQRENIELDSTKHPKHMFKIGYMRSSYNAGGINRILGTHCEGASLYSLFSAPDGGEQDEIDWAKARDNCNAAAQKLRAVRDGAKWAASEVDASLLGVSPVSERQAIEIAEKTLKPEDSGFENYSNRDGTWFTKGIPVYGVVHSRNCLGAPSVWLITKADPSHMTWYIEALEVAAEMCEWVLAQPDPKQFSLYWSG